MRTWIPTKFLEKGFEMLLYRIIYQNFHNFHSPQQYMPIHKRICTLFTFNAVFSVGTCCCHCRGLKTGQVVTGSIFSPPPPSLDGNKCLELNWYQHQPFRQKVTLFTCVTNAPSVLKRKGHEKILIAITNPEHTHIAAAFEMHLNGDAAVWVIARHVTLPPRLIKPTACSNCRMRWISWIPKGRIMREASKKP